MPTSHPPDRQQPDLQKNALEWSVFALSLVLVAGLLGYLAHAAATERAGAPRFTLEWGAPEAQNGGYALPVRVRNDGPATAADVEVEVTSGSEQARLTLRYVPRHSTRAGAVFFTAYPRNPTGRVRAYEQP